MINNRVFTDELRGKEMNEVSDQRRFAVLVDGDNAQASLLPLLRQVI